MSWEVQGTFRKQGTYVSLRLIHVDVWQRPTQHYEAIILPSKIKKRKDDFIYMALWTCPLLRHRQSLVSLPLSLFWLACNRQDWPVEVIFHVLSTSWSENGMHFYLFVGALSLGDCCQGSHMP